MLLQTSPAQETRHSKECGTLGSQHLIVSLTNLIQLSDTGPSPVGDKRHITGSSLLLAGVRSLLFSKDPRLTNTGEI